MQPKVPREDWIDWRWQFRHRLQSPEDFSGYLHLTTEEQRALTHSEGFAAGVTPYWASLMDPADPKCPIRRQSLPQIHELERGVNDLHDPLAEDEKSPVSHVIHRYPDRVVLIVTDTCHMYCRYCTRRRRVGFSESSISPSELEAALDYVKTHTEIRDVLISGGDPLVLSDSKLFEILNKVQALEHVEVIRMGTRSPVTNPFRITDELAEGLKQFHPLWINVQFNHYKEITADSTEACRKLADAGIPLGNQTVLLSGINDSLIVQRTLVHKLVQMRIRPYYLYQCDLAEGIEHFRTPVARGIEIIEGLQGHTSGFAVPTFVIDAPGGGGKIPVSPQYLISQSPSDVTLRNFEQRVFRYPEPRCSRQRLS